MRLSILITLLGTLTSHAADRPNILWFTAEDMSAALGCYGHPDAHTPHIDQFAKSAVRYTNAFATAPVCSPARSTLITGVYATATGTQRLRSDFPLPDHIKGFPSYLRAAGYHTTNNVKTDYNTSSEKRLIAESWNASSPTAHWRDRPNPASPFFHVYNDMTTHQSRSMVWPYDRFVAEVQSQIDPSTVHDPSKITLPPYYPDTPVVRKTVARFHDCVTAMDAHFGNMLAQLQEDGLDDDTIVFFYSDHGSGLPRHKRDLHDSGLHVPLLVHFPEKFKHLAPSDPGTTSKRLVSFVDFPPTVLSLLGLDIPGYMQGEAFLGPANAAPRKYVFGARDRVDEAFDVARSVRDQRYLYIRNFMPHLSWHQPTAYSDQGQIQHDITALLESGKLAPAQLTYAARSRPAELLYDTQADPHNLNNLAADPAHTETLARLRDVATDWSRECRDLGFVPELIARQRSIAAEKSPYEASADLRSWPIFNYRGAALSIGLGEKSLPVLVADLHSPDPVIRYWAMIGIQASPAEPGDDPDIDQAVKAALKDSSPTVRIEAAQFLKNLDVIITELASEHPEPVLQAARTIELLGDTAKPAHPALRTAYEKWKPRTDTPLALFIRFSAESTLGIPTVF